MYTPDSWNEKPLYSDVVSVPSFCLIQIRSQFSYLPTDTTDTDSEHDYGNNDLNRRLGNNTFKIDRRKIEKMIQTPSKKAGLNSAEYFFKNIMETTDTFISWPMNIQIGARTRKDPLVHIIGRPNDTDWAKGLILASLATRDPLLTMKMIIAENDHDHIIGPTRSNIKTIMEQTDTNIFFPYSNGRTMTEKKNQVLVYGRLDSLERTAAFLRLSTPLTMFFELPLGIPLSRQEMPDIKRLKRDLGVQIVFMSIPIKSSYCARVQGTHEIADKVKEAVGSLVNLICGRGVANTLSKVKLDVPKLLFDLSNTENKIDLLNLQEKTQTKIFIPDSEEEGQNITITGSIEMIYEVQKEIMSNLPIEFKFDIPENPHTTTSIMSLGMKYGISIRMQHREKDKSIAVTMRAAEKNMFNIFEAQKEAIKMQNTSRDETELPKAYLLDQPAYCKALENDISSGSQYEEMLKKIWAPIKPNTDKNCVYVEPSGDPVSSKSFFKLEKITDMQVSGQQKDPPSVSYVKPSGDPGSSGVYFNLEQIAGISGQQEDLPSAPFSPGTTCSSVDSSHQGRLSGDWSVMSTVHNDSHFDCDFDTDDDDSYEFMSSNENLTPMFRNAPGAEKNCKN